MNAQNDIVWWLKRSSLLVWTFGLFILFGLAHSPVSHAAGENLSIGLDWGLFEDENVEGQPPLAFVGVPDPIEAQLQADGTHRLFLLVQHDLSGDPYCAETPAGVEFLSTSLTSREGDPLEAGSYDSEYVWTPTEPGHYVLCGYLDSSASEKPELVNFVQFVVEESPGKLAFEVSPETTAPRHLRVTALGEAIGSSTLEVGVQPMDLPCGLPNRTPPVELLSQASSGTEISVGPGPFTTSYSYPSQTPGSYRLCGYLTGPSDDRPYAIGTGNFSVEPEPENVDESKSPPAGPSLPGSLGLLHVNHPALSAVSLTAKRFRLAGGRDPNSIERTSFGTILRFTLSQPSSLRITITRFTPGRLRGHSCLASSAALRVAHARACKRAVTIASLTQPGESSGSGEIAFNGLIGQTKLARGSYRVTIRASNANGVSAPVQVHFASPQ